eukprot:scaffold88899_cov21-Tisochrysis_lutea.AAC.1
MESTDGGGGQWLSSAGAGGQEGGRVQNSEAARVLHLHLSSPGASADLKQRSQPCMGMTCSEMLPWECNASVLCVGEPATRLWLQPDNLERQVKQAQ